MASEHPKSDEATVQDILPGAGRRTPMPAPKPGGGRNGPDNFKPVLDAIQQGEDAIYQGGVTAFLIWEAWFQARKVRPVSAATAHLYEIVWRTWLRFPKFEVNKVFTAANSADMEAVFKSLNASSKSNPELHHAGADIGDVTKRRYARILDDVYKASHLLLSDRSPADGWTPLKDAGDEIPKSEDAETFLLNREFRIALVKSLPSGGTLAKKRDGAILSLMLLQGLTSQEVSMLLTASVQFGHTTGLNEMQDPKGWPTAPAPAAIHVVATREAQARRLTLDERSARALQEWIAVRALWLHRRDSDHLFLGKRGNQAMTNRALFEISRNFVLEVMKAQCVKSALVHVGPMALRNSCLVAWLDQAMDPQEVLSKAGLKFLRSLERVVQRASSAAQARLREAMSLGAAAR